MKTLLAVLSNFLFLAVINAQPTQPPIPLTGNASNCTLLGTSGLAIDQCPSGSSVFQSNFQGGTYNRGNLGNNLGTNAVWRFPSITTAIISGVSTVINAEVTITGSFQAELTDMDDNTATDQAGVGMADLFAPVIRPDINLNTADRRGYVEFSVSFFRGAGNYSTAYAVNNLNFISYDADGSFDVSGTSSQSWFRETRVAQAYGTLPTIYGVLGTELTGYNYTDPVSTQWKGFGGSVFERTGLSRCAQVASAFTYGAGADARSTIKFRFGYDYKYRAGYSVGRPNRQFGAKFGCFDFINQVVLPLQLTSFNAGKNDNFVTLKWSTENEVAVSRYEVERSFNARDFETVGMKPASNRSATENYILTDNLSQESYTTVYYRLKMIDKDGNFKLSNILSLNNEGNSKEAVLSPNPLSKGQGLTLRMQGTENATLLINVFDMAGRKVNAQQAKINIGANSIQILNTNKLSAGYYIVQVVNGATITNHKLMVTN